MPKNIKYAAISGTLAMTLLSGLYLQAQQPTEPPPAPVPAQITAGRKAFISNASGEAITPPGTADLTYRQFYASMKSWGRYELVSVPADADVVLEIRYETPFGPVNNGNQGQYPQIRLSILDPKTHVILLAFVHPVVQVARKSTGIQNFQGAMDAILSDIKALASPTH